MNFLNNIKEKTIIVCPNNLKNKILKEINNYDRLINVKIYSLEDLKRFVLFDYNEDTILYLMDKYGYSYETSKNYIDNLYYIEDKKYNSDKLNFLVSLKKELIDNNKLIFNNLFIKSNKRYPFLVVGYDYLNAFDKKILLPFNYQIILKEDINSSIDVYEFNYLEDEVLFVTNKIIELIRKKIDVNNIYLINLDSNYNKEIIKTFKMFNIPVDISVSSNILSTIVGKNAFIKLEKTKSFNDTLEYIKTFDMNNHLIQEIYNTFLHIFNRYAKYEYKMELIISLIKNDLMNAEINNNTLINKVRVGNLSNSYYSDDEYVFLLGFNQGSIPKIFKDEEYINDELKEELSLDSVSVLNKLEKESTIVNIKSIKNIFISYKKNYLDAEFYPSNFVNEDMFNVVTISEQSTSNSLEYSKIKLSCMLDELIKYDKKDKLLSKYFSSFDIRFMEYDNKFKGLKRKSLYDYFNNKLTLSYSTLDTFYKCQFRYYLDNVLKLNKYEETFDTLIGSLFHYVLSHVYDENFELDKLYDKYLKDKSFDSKELFYLDKLKKELIIICDRLKTFQNDTGLTNVFTEKNIKIDKSTDMEIIFKGIIDKIMYREYDGKTLVSVIDYKTGSADIDIYNSIYGIGMQLIIYLYLIAKSNLFENYSFVGFYLQKILSGEVNVEKDKSYIDLKNENLKLYGYSCDDMVNLERFDPTYESSEYIKSMKTTKNGFGPYSKIVSEDDISSLIDLVDNKINNARDLILNCDFSINPKHISDDKEITGCKYCKYLDICNRKNEDIVNLKKYKDLSFLRAGDIDA